MTNMKEEKDQKTSDTIRGYVAVSFAVLLLWQVYLVYGMFKLTPTVKESLSNLGAVLPGITEIFFSVYRWTPILPIVTLLLAADIIRRKHIPKKYSIIGFGSAALTTLLLQMFYMQSTFAPWVQIIKMVGN